MIVTRWSSERNQPLSPLLSNIILNELDKEMEKQGLRYVRYADDFSIYTKSNSKARKVGNEIYLFLKNKLKLPINREKSGIRKPVNFTILGFGFVPTYVKGEQGKYQLVVSEKGWKTLKQKVNDRSYSYILWPVDDYFLLLSNILSSGSLLQSQSMMIKMRLSKTS